MSELIVQREVECFESMGRTGAKRKTHKMILVVLLDDGPTEVGSEHAE